MNTKFSVLVLGIGLTLLFMNPTIQAQESCAPASVECADASKVGIAVQDALRAANTSGLSGLSLKKAVLTLETVGTITDGININFLIFTIKHQSKKVNTITQEITWGSIPKPNAVGGGLPSLKDVLPRAIATAAQIASEVTAPALSEATITIKFVVDKDNGGSLSYKILGLTLGPNVDLDKTSTNTLAVTFAK
jgi:hypothetical protein